MTMVLTPDRKIHVRQHLVGNFLNTTPETTKKRAKEITNILNTTGFAPNKKIGMSAFIEHQAKHFNNDFSKEIKEFETECKDTVYTFNQEYLKLMQEIAAENLGEETIRRKNREFADKWREIQFT